MSHSEKQETVSITLVVNSNGRNNINPETGVALFENGDAVYVANDGHYVGTLTYSQGVFSGDIATPSESDYLHFYFMGNKTPEETISNTTSTLTVNISDQTNSYPEIAYAPSTVKYSSSVSTYHARLLNKCALVKFNVTTSSPSPTCIKCMKNKVSVNLGTQEFSYQQENAGIIKLAPGNGEKWAILLPQEGLDAGESGSAYSEDGNYTGTRGAVPAISENGYLTSGIDVDVSTSCISLGIITGLYTINADGDQVYFSKGNLQFQASTYTWRFAENQYDYIGNNNRYVSSTYDGWIDLFGWGTSGYSHGAGCYQPWSTSTNYASYYAYGNMAYHLYDQTGQADWGYNAISNGGNQENSGWRTLTKAEWDYLLFTRNTISGIRFARATVNGISGLILLPDDWSVSLYSLNSINGTGSNSFTTNNITQANWINIMEPNGVIFLPTSGNRVERTVDKVGSQGLYWSSENSGSVSRYLSFSTNGVSFGGAYRYVGESVRLVRNAE